MKASVSKILDAHKAAVRSIPKWIASKTGLLIAIYVGFGAIGVLDETVSRMHLPGGVAGTASSIASPSSALSSAAAQQVVIGWNDWAPSGLPAVMPLWGMLGLYMVFDLLLIAVPVALLLRRACTYADSRLLSLGLSAARESAIRGLLNISRTTAYFYLALDASENVALFLAGTSTSIGAVIATGILSIGKWLFLGAALVGLIIGLVGRPGAQRLPDDDSRSLAAIAKDHWEPVRAMRVHLGVAAFLLIFALLPGDLGHQLDDAFLYPFGGERFGMAVKTVIAVVILVAAMALTARACLAEYRAEHTAHVWPPATVHCQLVAGSLVAIIGGIALWQRWPVGVALLVPGAMLALLALISYWPKTTRDYNASDRPAQESQESALSAVYLLPMLAIALAVTPLVVLTALAVRNGIRLLTIYKLGYGLGLLVVFPVIATYVGWVVVTLAQLDPPLWQRFTQRASRWRWIPTWYRRFAARLSGSKIFLPAALASLSLAVFVFFAWSVQLSGTWLGPWGLVFAFSSAILLAATALVLLSNRIPNWPVLAILGFRRAPLILAVVLCSIVASTLDDHTNYHNTRLTNDAKHSELQLKDALGEWSKNPALGRPTGKPVPLVFVASAGGGIRAAYWTALVLGCIIPGEGDYPRPGGLPKEATSCEKSKMSKDSIFLASGISGGSLGLAATQAIPNRKDRLEALKFDFLAPTIAAMAFRDLPNSLLRVNISGQDRAAALEVAWENAAKVNNGDLTPDMTNSAYRSDGRPKFPLLLLNGTSVTDGCRVAVSTLDLARPTNASSTGDNPGAENCLALDEEQFSDANAFKPALAATKDAFDNTCTPTDPAAKDIRLSTAALLSARFPYVSPTGGLFSCNDDSGTFDLDGGLIDSSAAGPIAQMWPDIANWLSSQSACYSPKLIIIDNGYQSQTEAEPPARPLELVAPLTASGAISGARSAAARQAAALAFQKSFQGKALGKNCPTAPTVEGWTSPNVVDFYPVATPGIEAPLGWTLSYYSQTSLENQLGRNANQCYAEIVAQWFTAETAEPQICKKRDSEPVK